MAAGWIEPLSEALADARAFRGWSLRGAGRDDEAFMFALHRAAMRNHIDATWGWDEDWQRTNFAETYAPARQAVLVRRGAGNGDVGRDVDHDVGRVSLTRHWRKIFLRDIELLAPERNRGVGTAVINAVLKLARDSNRHVELRVLRANSAQRLYARLGFQVIGDDGTRLRMRAE